MKNYIEITDQNNVTRKVEIITIFKLDGYDYNYIIYKELDNSHDYIARFKDDNMKKLDTNLSPQEFELAQIIYEGVKA